MFKTGVGKENISVKAKLNDLGRLDKGSAFKINCHIKCGRDIVKREIFVNICKPSALRFFSRVLLFPSSF